MGMMKMFRMLGAVVFAQVYTFIKTQLLGLKGVHLYHMIALISQYQDAYAIDDE